MIQKFWGHRFMSKVLANSEASPLTISWLSDLRIQRIRTGIGSLESLIPPVRIWISMPPNTASECFSNSPIIFEKSKAPLTLWIGSKMSNRSTQSWTSWKKPPTNSTSSTECNSSWWVYVPKLPLMILQSWLPLVILWRNSGIFFLRRINFTCYSKMIMS